MSKTNKKALKEKVEKVKDIVEDVKGVIEDIPEEDKKAAVGYIKQILGWIKNKKKPARAEVVSVIAGLMSFVAVTMSTVQNSNTVEYLENSLDSIAYDLSADIDSVSHITKLFSNQGDSVISLGVPMVIDNVTMYNNKEVTE